MTRKSRATSASERAEVGSSMITTSASNASALAISTICWSPIRRSPTLARGEIGAPSRSKSRCASRLHRAVVEPAERPPVFSRPRKMLAGDREVGDEVQLLVDDPDARVLGVARAL